MAHIADMGVQLLAADGEPDERCKSCAFTPGTVPNGCLQTQQDALKAVVEGVPFLCHQANRKGEICWGFYGARVALRRASERSGQPLPVTACPWEFSPPDAEGDAP
jgi:hypothetical protein